MILLIPCTIFSPKFLTKLGHYVGLWKSSFPFVLIVSVFVRGLEKSACQNHHRNLFIQSFLDKNKTIDLHTKIIFNFFSLLQKLLRNWTITNSISPAKIKIENEIEMPFFLPLIKRLHLKLKYFSITSLSKLDAHSPHIL